MLFASCPQQKLSPCTASTKLNTSCHTHLPGPGHAQLRAWLQFEPSKSKSKCMSTIENSDPKHPKNSLVCLCKKACAKTPETSQSPQLFQFLISRTRTTCQGLPQPWPGPTKFSGESKTKNDRVMRNFLWPRCTPGR